MSVLSLKDANKIKESLSIRISKLEESDKQNKEYIAKLFEALSIQQKALEYLTQAGNKSPFTLSAHDEIERQARMSKQFMEMQNTCFLPPEDK